jgi:hypothetical protein
MEDEANRKRESGTAQGPGPDPKKPKLDQPTESTASTSGETNKAKMPVKTAKGLSTKKPIFEKHVKQASSNILATINPSVPLTKQQKLEKMAEIEKAGKPEILKGASPEEERFLRQVFKNTASEWPAGYEDGLLLVNAPPTIQDTVPDPEDPTKSKIVNVFGPVPKLDPDYLVPGLAGYSAAKVYTNQPMTTWDHQFVFWMQVHNLSCETERLRIENSQQTYILIQIHCL